MVRRDAAVESIEREVREDLAGNDSIHRVGTGDAAEGDEIEKSLRRRAQRQQCGAVERIRNTHTLERTPQGVAQRSREPNAGLRIVLQVLQHSTRQVQVLPAEDRELPRLVIADLVAEHRESKLQWPVKHVRLRVAKQHAARQVSEADLHLQGFAATHEVVGGVVHSNERSLQTAYASVQADAVLAFLFNVKRQVHVAVLLVQSLFRDVGIVGLDLIEIRKLVQPQQAQLPQARVVDAAFFESQLPADDLVASRRIALELDAPHRERLAFVDIDLQEGQLLLVIERGLRKAGVVDVAILAIRLPQVFQALGDLLAAENIAILQRNHRAQRRRIRN